MSVTSKRPIRILLTVPHLNRTASPYRETMALAKYLSRAEFHLTICALRNSGFSETAPILQDIGVPCFVAAFRPTGRSPRHFLASFREQKTINRYGPFDIQHSLDFTSSPFEAVMARLHLRPFVYSQRNLNENGHKSLLKIKAACAQRIITISGTVSRFLLAEGVRSRTIREIYLGLDIESNGDGHRTPLSEHPYILFIGQFEPRKRHQDAIRAFALIQTEFPTLDLWLVGNTFDEQYLKELRELVDQLGLSKRIHFLGPRTDVLDLMRSASALLLCSESEAFGWVLVEAMSVGLPIVCSAVDGPCELIEHEKNGLLVPVGDIQGYAYQLRRLISSRELPSALSAHALSTVKEKHSALAMVHKIQAVYREMLASRGMHQ
jgi:glycosyltransferase involved in cell wall biosynthesis